MNKRPTVRQNAVPCSGPLKRRDFLKAGALGLGGFGLADLLRLRTQAAEVQLQSTPDTSVIFIWLPGGVSHLETYDMKPDAPRDYRGELNPIPTNVPGLDVCELLPLHAKIADQYNIVRSVCHDFNDHGGGHKRFLTGRIPKTPVGFVNDAPAAASIVAKAREHVNVGLPNYISGANAGRDGVDVYSFGAAYLGPAYTPFSVPGDPSAPDFQVQNLSLNQSMSDRLDDRRTLLTGLDNLKRNIDQSGAMAAMDDFEQQAINLLTSPQARNAFDLSQEPESLRRRYGMHTWGQRALLARRLVEARCSFVTMVMENPYQSGLTQPDYGVYNWDSHAVNCHLYKDAAHRFPIYDQAVTALVEDLHQRGLTEKVMLIVTGEFGRTPKINTQKGSRNGLLQPGRDHWARAMSFLICGGGMRTGQVIGATNSKGEHPVERQLTPNDLWATVYRHLGISPSLEYPDHNGRPMPILPFGKPIAELT
ncbi:MAG: DUF1501 domain-containing protein [Planctomycetaceae bacterium]|nr:DUF1501 domain-containing protein [Planctomycetaceae bacterium]